MTRNTRLLLILLVCLVSGGCGLTESDTYDSVKYKQVHEVTLNGDCAKMDELLDANPALLNIPDYDKNTLLHFAVLRNHLVEVEHLLARNADVNAVNTTHMTPLHFAAKSGETEIAKLLLSRQPDLTIRDKRGWTALTWAVKGHHEPVAELLRNAGARE